MHVAVLSPHRDDAAFSCGLTLHNLLRAGCILSIVNVCTISRYAPCANQCSGDLAQQITKLRQDEDAAFVEKLCHPAAAENGHVELIDLEWQDVPIRWHIEDDQTLAPLKLRPQEIKELGSVFRALQPFDIIFVPMALGGHVDHRLVLQAALQALPASSLVFYEDLPYACSMSPPERASAELRFDVPLTEIRLPLAGAARGLKQKYALCYPSQIAVDIAEEMDSYATTHGGRECFLAGSEAMRTLTAALHYKVALPIAWPK